MARRPPQPGHTPQWDGPEQIKNDLQGLLRSLHQADRATATAYAANLADHLRARRPIPSRSELGKICRDCYVDTQLEPDDN